MQQLVFEEAGRYGWQEVPDPEITAPEHALVRPLAVACCDLDVAVCQGRLPMPPATPWVMRAWVKWSPSATRSATSGR